MVSVKFTKCNDYAAIPYRGSKEAAGYDLCAAISDEIKIAPNEVVKIPTGLKIALPAGTFGAIFARSGLATKSGLAPANMVGVIDSDYRGECIVALRNYSNETRIIHPTDRIAQLIVIPFIAVDFIETNNLETTVRGEGGFGHTGI